MVLSPRIASFAITGAISLAGVGFSALAWSAARPPECATEATQDLIAFVSSVQSANTPKHAKNGQLWCDISDGHIEAEMQLDGGATLRTSIPEMRTTVTDGEASGCLELRGADGMSMAIFQGRATGQYLIMADAQHPDACRYFTP